MGYIVAHTIYDCIYVKVLIALPENYAELMDQRPDEGCFNKHNFNKDSSNKRVFSKRRKQSWPKERRIRYVTTKKNKMEKKSSY